MTTWFETGRTLVLNSNFIIANDHDWQIPNEQFTYLLPLVPPTAAGLDPLSTRLPRHRYKLGTEYSVLFVIGTLWPRFELVHS